VPAKKEYTAEFKEQAVRFVLEEMEPDEPRKHACDRLAPRLSVKAVTLYNWVKQSAPAKARPAASAGSVEELRAQNAALRKENRELARANAILSDAAAFFGAVPPRLFDNVVFAQVAAENTIGAFHSLQELLVHSHPVCCEVSSSVKLYGALFARLLPSSTRFLTSASAGSYLLT
jgi:transposase